MQIYPKLHVHLIVSRLGSSRYVCRVLCGAARAGEIGEVGLQQLSRTKKNKGRKSKKQKHEKKKKRNWMLDNLLLNSTSYLGEERRVL